MPVYESLYHMPYPIMTYYLDLAITFPESKEFFSSFYEENECEVIALHCAKGGVGKNIN